MTQNPYSDLPKNAFWRTAVADNSMFDLSDLHEPKFDLRPKDAVATYGSCFAQHFGRALEARGYNWLRTELAPKGLSAASRKRFNYDVFSARTGNIYTTSLLLQWVHWAAGEATPPDEIWEKDGRFYDPFRPRIEPDGFATREELLETRAHTIACFGESIRQADVFVFTMGLTESWKNAQNGCEYPMCPGTVAGEFDPDLHVFENQSYETILANLRAALKLMKGLNSKLRTILTVSPVPLTATMSGRHVLVATSASKSILRAVAEEFQNKRPRVDYFPSYEIIASPVFRGAFYEPNQREVNPHGVNLVMDHFFAGIFKKFGVPKTLKKETASGSADEDLVCEEALLEAFG